MPAGQRHRGAETCGRHRRGMNRGPIRCRHRRPRIPREGAPRHRVRSHHLHLRHTPQVGGPRVPPRCLRPRHTPPVEAPQPEARYHRPHPRHTPQVEAPRPEARSHRPHLRSMVPGHRWGNPQCRPLPRTPRPSAADSTRHHHRRHLRRPHHHRPLRWPPPVDNGPNPGRLPAAPDKVTVGHGVVS